MEADQNIILLAGSCITFLFLVALLKLYLPEESPLPLLWRFIRKHALSTRSLFYLLTISAIIAADILETHFDATIGDIVQWDFTPLFLQIEGSTTSLFQIIHFPMLTYALSFVYLYLFPVMGVAAIIAVYTRGEKDIARKLFWGAIFNYVLILPFYVLFPVSERWTAGGGQVSLLMNNISPILIQGLRPMSGLNNCFPSFHASLSLTIALIMASSANRRARRITYAITCLVVYSTLYLGFHWLLDVFGGVLFASVCTLMATYAVENYPMELALFRVQWRRR